MGQNQIPNAQMRQKLRSLILKQDSDEEEHMVQTCAEKKHTWTPNNNKNDQDCDSSSNDFITKYNELKATTKDLLQGLRELCHGKNT